MTRSEMVLNMRTLERLAEKETDTAKIADMRESIAMYEEALRADIKPDGFPGDLLDWFAGQAMAGMLVGEQWREETVACAKVAYEHAAAMIAEKRRREGGAA